MTEIKQPKIRFKGFTDVWEQYKLGDLAEIVGGGTPSTKVSEYWNGNIDWYAPAELGSKIYLKKSEKTITELGLKKSSAKLLPIGTVLFTSRAGIGNTAILEKEGTTNQGFQSIVPKSDILDTYFIYSRTKELKKYGETKGAGTTFIEVSGKEMSKMNINVPNIEEQQKIGAFFKSLDDTIALHQQKLEVTKQFKQTMLKKMFPKNGETTPEIRFKGFTDDWEDDKFLNIFNKYSEKNINSFEQYTIGKKGVKKIEKDILYAVENHKLFKPNSLILGLGIEEMGVSEDIFGSCSPIYTTYNIKQANTLFIKYFINGFLNINKNKVTKTSTRREFEIVIRDVEKLNLRLPNSQEQELIGNYFKELDNQINYLEQKLEKYKEFKKAMLQKMFI